MQKLKAIFFVSLVIAGVCFSNIATAVTYPNLRGYVNDFANVIPKETEEGMESFLADYENKTSIEIVVVTTPTLEGLDVADWTMGLVSRDGAKEWHIGKKGEDNGLVVVVAPNERESRIEVGYGLEGEITDLIAGRITKNQMIPAFKEGKVAKGINNALKAITQKLGYSSTEERAERKRLAKEESKRKMKQMGATGAIIAALMTLVYAIYRGIKFIKAYFAERRRKKELRERLYKDLESLKEFKEATQEQACNLEAIAGNVPAWVASIVKEQVENALNKVVLLSHLIEQIGSNIKDDPDTSYDLLDHTAFHLKSEIMDSLSRGQKSLNTFADQRTTAKSTVNDITAILAFIERDLASALEEGFVFPNLDMGLEKDLKSLDERLSSDDTGRGSNIRAISSGIEALFEEVKAEYAMISSITSSKKRVDEAIPLLATRKVATTNDLEEAREVFAEITAQNPKSVWVEAEKRLDLIPRELLDAEALLSQAKKAGSMQEQKFTNALSYIKAVRQIIDESDLAIQAVEDLRNNIAEAKIKQPKFLRDAKKRLESASKFVGNNDVDFEVEREPAKYSDPKMSLQQKLDKAKAEFKESQRMVKDEPVDWIYLVTILSLVISLSAEVIKHSEADIQATKKERKRLAAKKKKKRREDSYSSTGSYSSSSSSSGGFGGFGGGGFGGGGASGSW